ncbi:MAG: ABC transporter permease [Firmicutes bacterium]|nr:ABC transporter permease [Bacillota bacterium]
MNNSDIFSMAIKNLFKRKVRTFLTVLGVMVGTAAITIMVSLGLAMSDSFDEQLKNMADITIISIYNSDNAANSAKNTIMDKAAIEKMKALEGVKTATPIYNTSIRFVSGKYVADLDVAGIDESAMEELGYKTAKGRLLESSDAGTYSFVFGANTPSYFAKPGKRMYYFGGGEQKIYVDPMEDNVSVSVDSSYGEKKTDGEKKKSVKPTKINCIGLLEEKDYRVDYSVFTPLEIAEKLDSEKKKFEKQNNNNSQGGANTKKRGYQNAYVKCNSIDDVEGVCEKIKEMGFEVYSEMDYIKPMQEMSNSLQMLLGAIGAVSLFIAAIGITNTMIMAIYERTKEIGVMKVIGARISDIKKLFLLEATLIGFFGGVCGIAVSLLVSAILNNFNTPLSSIGGMGGMGMYMADEAPAVAVSVMPLWLCLSALAFSSFIGLISGYFPARRAMKLSALKAIKTE